MTVRKNQRYNSQPQGPCRLAPEVWVAWGAWGSNTGTAMLRGGYTGTGIAHYSTSAHSIAYGSNGGYNVVSSINDDVRSWWNTVGSPTPWGYAYGSVYRGSFTVVSAFTLGGTLGGTTNVYCGNPSGGTSTLINVNADGSVACVDENFVNYTSVAGLITPGKAHAVALEISSIDGTSIHNMRLWVNGNLAVSSSSFSMYDATSQLISCAPRSYGDPINGPTGVMTHAVMVLDGATWGRAYTETSASPYRAFVRVTKPFPGIQFPINQDPNSYGLYRRKINRTRQPQHATQLEWCGYRIISAFNPGAAISTDLVGRPFTVVNSAGEYAITRYKDGTAYSTSATFGGSGGEGVWRSQNSSHTTGKTLIFKGVQRVAGYNNALSSMTDSNSFTSKYRAVMVDGATSQLKMIQSGNTATSSVNSTAALSDGDAFTAIAIFKSDSIKLFYSMPSGRGVVTDTTNPGTIPDTINVGYLGLGAAEWWSANTRLLLGVWLEGDITDNLASSLLDNPWQLFAHQQKLLPAFVRPAADTNLYTATKRKITRTSQPQGYSRIDWGNSLTRGLNHIYNPAFGLTDPISGQVWQEMGYGRVFSTGLHGRNLDSTAGGFSRYAGLYMNLPNEPLAVTQTHALLVEYVQKPANYSGIIATSNITGSGDGLSFQDGGGGTFGIFGAGFSFSSSSVSSNAGFGPSILIVAGDATSSEAYLNGIQVLSGGVASAGQSSTQIVLLGVRDPVTNDTLTVAARLYGYLGWNRKLSFGEIQSLSKNFWQLFAPRTTALPLLFQQAPQTYGRIKRKLTRARQPQTTPQINWGNPITRGLTGLIDGSATGLKGDIVAKKKAWEVLNNTIATADGFSIGQMTTGQAAGLSWRPPVDGVEADREPPAWKPSSLVISSAIYVTYHAHPTGSMSFFGTGPGTGTGFYIGAAFGDGTPVSIIYTDTGYSGVYGATGDFVPGKSYMLISVSDGTTQWLVMNGRVLGSTAVPGSSIAYDATYTQTILGAATRFGWNAPPCSYHFAAIWNRALSLAEALDLSRNPWQLFSQREVPYPVAFATPADTNSYGIYSKRRMRTNQPQVTTKTNTTNPLSRGLIALVDGRLGVNVLEGALPISNSATQDITERGIALRSQGSSVSFTQNTRFVYNRPTTALSSLSVFTLTDQYGTLGAPNNFLFGDTAYNAGSDYNWGTYNNSVNFISFVRNTGGTGVPVYGSTVPAVQNWRNNFRHCFTYDGSLIRHYEDGILISSAAQSGNVQNSALDLSFNRWNPGTGDHGQRMYMGAVWNRALTDAEVRALSDNPWQLFTPRQVAYPLQFVTTSISIYRPGSDIVFSGWTGTPDNSNKFANINETVASDSEYVTSPNLSAATPLIMGLDNPIPVGTYDISIRGKYSGSSGKVRILMLDDTNTVLATSSWQSLTTGFSTYLLNVVLTSTATRIKVEVAQ